MRIVNVIGFEGLYAVNDEGIVYNTVKGSVMKTRVNAFGYETVCLSKGNEKKHFRVHRLVYESFFGRKGDNLVIDHIDNNKLNNRLDNLRKLTNRENVSRSKVSKHGRGVRFYPHLNKFGAYIQINKVPYHLGIFHTQQEASIAYNKALSDWEENGILPEKRDRSIKTCKVCGQIKPIAEFYYIKGHGHQTYCKECQKAYGKEYRNKLKERNKNEIN